MGLGLSLAVCCIAAIQQGPEDVFRCVEFLSGVGELVVACKKSLGIVGD